MRTTHLSNWMIAVVVLAPLAAAGGQLKKKSSKPGPASESIVVGDVGKKLDAYVSSAANFPKGFSGAVLVAKGGKILLQKGAGVADADEQTTIGADSLWDWCSITKQFTAAAILKLAMQKKLALDDTLQKHFPKVAADKAGVTLRQLLNHTSGIGTPDFQGVDLRDREAFTKAFLGAPIASKPGEKWEYSNMAYVFLAVVVEKLSGKSYEAFCEENLFGPAGMKDAGFIGDGKIELARVPRDARGTGKQFAYGYDMTWGYRGCGGVVAGLKDMLAWHVALGGNKVLDEAAKKEFYKVGLNHYALGWDVSRDSGHLTYSHSGHTGDVVTFYLRDVEADVVVALALNEEPKTHPATTAAALAAIAR